MLTSLIAIDLFGMGAMLVWMLYPGVFLTMDISRILLMSFIVAAPPVALGALLHRIAAVSRVYDDIPGGLPHSIIYACMTHMVIGGGQAFARVLIKLYPLTWLLRWLPKFPMPPLGQVATVSVMTVALCIYVGRKQASQKGTPKSE